MLVRQEFGMIRTLYEDGNVTAINPAHIQSWQYAKADDIFIIHYANGKTSFIRKDGMSDKCWHMFKQDMANTVSRSILFE